MRLVLDTHIYVDALRSDAGAETLGRLEEIGRFVWLNAVVAHELMIGVHRMRGRGREEAVIRPFIDRGRILTPSFDAWQRSGQAIAALHARGRIDERRVPKSFANDLLIAASCAEESVTLVTRNARDFALIAEEIPFQFIPPWT